MDIRRKITMSVFLFVAASSYADDLSEVLTLQQAIETSLDNYESIKSKTYLTQSAKDNISNSKSMLLPEIKFSGQQTYGTANSVLGPQYGFGEGMTSTAMPQESQNWDAAFGALYLVNFNWNIFSFGHLKNNIDLSKSEYRLRQAELQQEKFNHQIKVAGAYFNLLAIQQVVEVQKKNVERADILLKTVRSLTQSGIKPAVELSISEAELAKAKIALLKSQDKEVECAIQLGVLIGTEKNAFSLDDMYLSNVPQNRNFDVVGGYTHPSLLQKQSIIDISRQKTKLYNSEGLPKINLVGSVAGRGSGFGSNYMSDHSALSHSYKEGVKISRSNYLLGVGVSWNFTSFLRNRSKISSQRSVSKAAEMEMQLTHNELRAMVDYADEKIIITQNQHQESLKQVKASSESYQQYLAMYKSGLADISEVAQAMYTLAASESEEKVLSINIWQSYLLKIAGNGDMESFLAQINN